VGSSKSFMENLHKDFAALTYEVFHDRMGRPQERKCGFVMLAWIAGIHQVRKDASETSMSTLDSSTPCWNDTVGESLLRVTGRQSQP
jgi:hypothetical protein